MRAINQYGLSLSFSPILALLNRCAFFLILRHKEKHKKYCKYNPHNLFFLN